MNGRVMKLPDFASVIPTIRDQRRTGDAAVIVTIVRNRSALELRASQRIVVTQHGAISGEFPASTIDQFRTDALTCLAEHRSRLLSYVARDGSPVRAAPQKGELDVYFDVLDRTPRLVVVGGGHIAVPLVRIAAVLRYAVTVLDDRAEYATAERFPDAETVLHGPYRETLARIPVDADTYIVLVTRGHVHDAACLQQVLHSPARYIGMIGSKKRVRTVLDHVVGPEPSSDLLSRIYAPIGVDIGSTTPEEIAVAIAAELVKLRRGGQALSLTIAAPSHV